jgi:O-antigen ligase
VSKSTQYLVLSILLFSLPLSEAVKNIAWVLCIILWLYDNRKRFDRNGIFSIDFIGLNLLFFIIIITPYLVAFFCNTGLDEWDGAWDVTRYGLIGWIICHSKYTVSKINYLSTVLVLSAFIGCAFGIWRHLEFGELIELHSVGHVNHSAIYLGLILGILISRILARFYFSRQQFILIIVTTILLFFVFLEMSARGAFIPLFIFAILMLILKKFNQCISFLTIFYTLIVFLLAIYFNLGMVNKFLYVGDGNRIKLFNTSLVIFQYSPLWGVGLENSKFFFTPEGFDKVCNLLNVTFDPKFHQADCYHAHNIYMQSLVERGIFGSIPLFVFLIYWAVKLIKDYSLLLDSFTKFVWGSSLSAFIMVFIGGIFNTTLHHEHGLLSIVLFAFHYSIFSRSCVTKTTDNSNYV